MSEETHLVASVATQHALTAADVRGHVNLIQQVMKAVMKENVHYGKIPGTEKPTLLKPGAEVLFTTFQIAVDPLVEEIIQGEHSRYRVSAKATSASGRSLGSAFGEASTEEEKYCWRKAVCQEEFEQTPENRRRVKWRSGRDGAYSQMQIRTSAADVRNTVLKMAVKRAYVALALQVLAASDIFSQDIEDLPDDIRRQVLDSDEAAPPSDNEAPPRQDKPRAPSGAVISEAQGGRLVAIAKNAGMSRDNVIEYLNSIGIDTIDDIPKSKYDAIVKHFSGGNGNAQASARPKTAAPF